MTLSDTERLLAIEAIKTLKARYFRCMDTQDWQGLTACFAEDLKADFREGPGPQSDNRADYMAMLTEALKHAKTVHHGHMPEITLHDASTASGIWAMDDIVYLPDLTLRGWGHYHEEYRREASGWVISKIRLTRLDVQMEQVPDA